MTLSNTSKGRSYDAAVEAVKAEIARQADAKKTSEAMSAVRRTNQRVRDVDLDKPMTKREVMKFVKRLEAGTLSDDEESRHYERLDDDGEYSQQISDEIEESTLRELCETAGVPYDVPDANLDWTELAWAADVLEDSTSDPEERSEAEIALLGEEDAIIDEPELAGEMTKADFATMLQDSVRKGMVPEGQYGPEGDPHAVEKAEAAVGRHQKLQVAIRKARGDELADFVSPGTLGGSISPDSGSVDSGLASEYD